MKDSGAMPIPFSVFPAYIVASRLAAANMSTIYQHSFKLSQLCGLQNRLAPLV